MSKGREIADELGANISSVFLTPDGEDAEELLYHGADRVFLFESPVFGLPKEMIFKENINELIRRETPEIFLIGATRFGRSLAPRISASLKTGLTADCTGLEVDEAGEFIQIRPAFTGNVLAHIKTSTRPKMSTVRFGEFEKPDRDPNRSGEIIEMDPFVEESKDVEISERVEEEDVNLENEKVIVSGGRGLKEPSDFELLRELAELLGGEIGSSRPLVDEGWLDRCYQVGYSGKRVKPDLYFACGISGASQHLAGMKESDTIIAINSDPSAPIFDVADYGIVGDLYEVIPKLIERIKEVSDDEKRSN